MSYDTLSIIDKIMIHKKAYELSGMLVPPFRITGHEHLLLRKSVLGNDSKKDELILNCLGVDLEPVSLVEVGDF